MKNLSLHSKHSHKAYSYKKEDDSFLESILNLQMFEKDISALSDYILFDIENETIIGESDTIGNFSFEKYSPETLEIKGLEPGAFLGFKLPKSIHFLNIDGGEYMSNLLNKNVKQLKIWQEYVSNAHKARFSADMEQRLEIEAEMRGVLKVIETFDLSSPINAVLKQIPDSGITELALGWIYLSKKELDLLHGFKNLESLDLRYNFNDHFKESKLPASLKYLTIYGTTIESLSQINWQGLSLEVLSLEGNAIKDLSDLDKIPDSIEDLDLSLNLIESFRLEDMPEKLEHLTLRSNCLNNTLFEAENSGVVRPDVVYLDLSYNQFKINNWLLLRITETFPNLGYIDLSGNEICGVPEDLAVNGDEISSIENIRDWMDLYEQRNGEMPYSELSDTLNYYQKASSIVLNWTHEQLPSGLILSDIQNRLSGYLDSMPAFKLFKDGLYCDIEHNKISIIIREETGGENSIILEMHSADKNTFGGYFYQYFSEIKGLVELNTHHHILPLGTFSEGCGVYNDFFNFVYQIDKKIRKKPILKSDEFGKQLFFNIDISKNANYIPLSSLAFIIKVHHYFFAFIWDENNILCNYVRYADEYFKLNLKDLENKVYSESLSNKNLGESALIEVMLKAARNNTQHNTFFYNPRYFTQKNGKLIIKDLKLSTDGARISFPEKEGKKLEVKAENNAVWVEKWI